jgi:hypothetical protein
MDGAATVGGDAPLLTETCEDGVLRLVLNRPAQRNALSVGLMTALREALDRAAADKAPSSRIAAPARPSAPGTICASSVRSPATTGARRTSGSSRNAVR